MTVVKIKSQKAQKRVSEKRYHIWRLWKIKQRESNQLENKINHPEKNEIDVDSLKKILKVH